MLVMMLLYILCDVFVDVTFVDILYRLKFLLIFQILLNCLIIYW